MQATHTTLATAAPTTQTRDETSASAENEVPSSHRQAQTLHQPRNTYKVSVKTLPTTIPRITDPQGLAAELQRLEGSDQKMVNACLEHQPVGRCR